MGLSAGTKTFEIGKLTKYKSHVNETSKKPPKNVMKLTKP